MPGSGPKVIVIGAGLGGLTLAQSLRHKGVDFEIFERDESAQARTQGWAITLHWMIPELRKIIAPSAPPLENVSVSHGTGKTDHAGFFNAYTKEVHGMGRGGGGGGQGGGPSGDFIRANRANLRQWLLTGLNVNWGKRYSKYEIVEDNEGGGVVAFFEDGTSVKGDIIVGADGIQSRVRSQLFAPNPPTLNVLPVGILAGEVTLTRPQYTRQFENLAGSFVLAIADRESDRFRLFTGLKSVSPDLSSAEYYWILSWYDEDAAKDGYWTETASNEEQLKFAREKVEKAEVHDDLGEILKYQESERMLKPFVIRDLVPMEAPESAGPVTIIGDAAHPMSFFRGEGANTAMLDAVELSTLIQQSIASSASSEPSPSKTSYWDVLRSYEKGMLPRATKSVLISRTAATDLALSVPDVLKKQ